MSEGGSEQSANGATQGAAPSSRGLVRSVDHWLGRRDVVAALLTVVIVGFWLFRIHGPGVESHPFTPLSDHYRYFYPAAAFMHEELQSGRAPLWNPYQYAGEPFVALPVAGALYPVNWLFFGLFEPGLALDLHGVFHLVLAGLFTWLLAARLGLAPVARLLTALTFALSGSMLLGVLMTPYFSTQVWLPACAWALHGWLSERRPGWIACLAAMAALFFLGGLHQAFLGGVYFLAAFGLFGLVAWTPRSAWPKAIAGVVAAGAVALLLAAPLLLPIVEYATQATRSLEGLNKVAASFPVVRPEHMWEGLFGGYFGRDPRLFHDLSWGRVAFSLFFPVLAVLGAFAPRRVALWLFFLAAFGFTHSLMKGGVGWAYHVFYLLPGVDLFRGAVRYVYLYAFAGAFLIGLGIDAIARRGGRLPGRVGRVAPVLSLLLLVVVTFEFIARARLGFLTPMVVPPDLRLAEAIVAERPEATRDRRVFLQMRGIELQDWMEKFGTLARFRVVPDYEPSVTQSYARFFGHTTPKPWHGAVTVMPGLMGQAPTASPRILDLMSVGLYVIPHAKRSGPPEAFAEAVGGTLSETENLVMVERRQALPRAYVVDRVAFAGDDETAFERIFAPDFDPRVEAVVTWSGSGSPPEIPRTASSRGASEPGRVVLSDVDPQTVELDVTCHRPACLVVLTDLHYPGWQASVDGRKAPLLKANALFRGVRVEQGEHRIVQEFRPRSVRFGAVAGAVGLSALAGLVFAARCSGGSQAAEPGYSM